MQKVICIELDIKFSGAVQINDTLQGQVANLQNDNQSFQTRVTALQETTTSLSAQIGALARQAQTAANAANQLQVRQAQGYTIALLNVDLRGMPAHDDALCVVFIDDALL